MITPFTVTFDPDDLRTRLRRTRWPSAQTAPGWAQGTPLEFARSLCTYWADGYDFDAAAQRLNRHPQFRTVIDGVAIHFLHARSERPDARPLLMTHGWPGSVVEFAEVVTPLTTPPPGEPAFHVVCPSLPGYGFSDQPAVAGWTVHRVADAWAELMTRLDYPRFIAEGHDWGTTISTSLAVRHPHRLIGIHLMPPLVAPLDPVTPAERKSIADLTAAATGDGYSLEQSTRPQTIGYALVDSPAALCAWIIEKFHAWTDHDGDLSTVFTDDQLLDNLMLYWLPATGASAARLYWESFAEVQAVFRTGTTDVITAPTACSVFPREIPHPSRRWAEQRFPNIHYWNEPPRGGHFAAFEQPALFIQEIRNAAHHWPEPARSRPPA
ncbi:epoxide hydrolase family protein [Paractinoplanes toevensis]|uniref:Hydrolase n=1 Tax=Paractinoplanes toevensis TaxID=571911 RepID=A0A919TCT4_9ACTN|nr:epoxide hydrolase family protein [Actinoplanes toevensis]GIM91736.1 hydrolase [Actinoplanes toevensis]